MIDETDRSGGAVEPNAELPEDVVMAIRAGRTIEAIKLLREHRGLDLADAKAALDAYSGSHPEVRTPSPVQTDSGPARFIGLAIVIAILYLAYRYLASS